jgi:hypothetical protein
MKATIGTVHAATTQPSAVAELSMCRTANANAIPDIEDPAVLIVSPKKNRRKFGCRSTPRRPGAISDPRT